MKKTRAVIFAVLLMVTLTVCRTKPNSVGAAAGGDINALDAVIIVDMVELASDTPPHTVKSSSGDDIIMVPAQGVFEAAGYRTVWVPEEQRLEVYESSGGNLAYVFVIGHPVAWFVIYAEELNEFLNGEEQLLSPAVLINGKEFIPLHFITGRVGFRWDCAVDSGDIYLFSPAGVF